MKAMQLVFIDGKPVVKAGEIPQPRPGAGEVLVRVRASGVMITELQWYPTNHTEAGGPREQPVPGHEFSGEVAELGDGVSGIAVGDEVYGFNDWFVNGAMAEFCVVKAEVIAAKPARLTHAEAAVVPIGALTAWQGLFTRAKLQAGERVLIHGGSGSVGSFAVQLAKVHGAHVISTASARNAALVKELGAETVIDYKAAPFEEQVRDLDVVFDTVGGDTLNRSWGVLKAGGRVVTISSDVENSTESRIKAAFFIVEPSREQLTEVGRLIDAGELRVLVNAVVPFEQAPAAYADTISGKLGYGKVAVTVA